MRTLKAVSRFTALVLCIVAAHAQERPFLFSLVAPDATHRAVVVHYDAAYGQETFEPMGGDRIEQTLGIHAGFGESVTLIARFGFAFHGASNASSQHAELLLHVLKSADGPFDLSIGPGLRHEYSGTNVLLGRAVLGRRFSTWQLYGNLLLEKPLSTQRDAIDLFMTLGWSYDLSAAFQCGIEAVGQDLEGFWDENEAEGGAVLFAGPTFSAAIPGTPWTFTLGAGPIVRATHSIRTASPARDLPTPRDNGFVVHAAVNFAW